MPANATSVFSEQFFCFCLLFAVFDRWRDGETREDTFSFGDRSIKFHFATTTRIEGPRPKTFGINAMSTVPAYTRDKRKITWYDSENESSTKSDEKTIPFLR